MSGDRFSGRYSIVAETRRCWSDAEKDAIIAEAERPGVNISAVARRHGIKPSLLFRWRRLARHGKGHRSGPAFILITLALPAAQTAAPAACDPGTSSKSPPPTEAVQHPADGRIEIELGNGCRIRVGTDVDIALLRRILDLLERR